MNNKPNPGPPLHKMVTNTHQLFQLQDKTIKTIDYFIKAIIHK